LILLSLGGRCKGHGVNRGASFTGQTACLLT